MRSAPPLKRKSWLCAGLLRCHNPSALRRTERMRSKDPLTPTLDPLATQSAVTS
jgi:hypothetical protein